MLSWVLWASREQDGVAQRASIGGVRGEVNIQNTVKIAQYKSSLGNPLTVHAKWREGKVTFSGKGTPLSALC